MADKLLRRFRGLLAAICHDTSADIRQIPGRFEAKGALLTEFGIGKRRRRE